MAPRESDDEQELINAEFEAMVSGLNLDESSSRTYLDELEEMDKQQSRELYLPPRRKGDLRSRASAIVETIKSWWRRPGSNDGDGAVV